MSAYSLERKPSCKESMLKATHKNSLLREALEKKVAQILDDPHRFKPLRAPLDGLRRVHLLNCFVLTYAIDEKNRVVTLMKFAHHDDAYK